MCDYMAQSEKHLRSLADDLRPLSNIYTTAHKLR